MPHKLCWAPEGIPAKKPAGRYQLEWLCKQNPAPVFFILQIQEWKKKQQIKKKKSHIETAFTRPTESPRHAEHFKERSHQLGWAPFLRVHLISNRMMPDFIPFLHTHCQVAGKQRGAANNHLKKRMNKLPLFCSFLLKSQQAPEFTPARSSSVPQTFCRIPLLAPQHNALSPGADYLSTATSELLVTSSSIRVLVGHLLSLQVSVKDLAVSKILLSEVLLMESCAWEHFRYCIMVLTTRKPRYLEQIPLVRATNSGSCYA